MATERRESVLMLFVKRPKPGKVKTRLASTVGNEAAVAVYKGLLDRTRNVVAPVLVDKQVHYGTTPEPGDVWERDGYARFSQQGNSLGQRMENAFRQAFASGYSKVIIIGSDCYQLESSHLRRALEVLDASDAVLGPSTDGGYYLLGMRKLIPEVFYNKEWSTESVAEATRNDFKAIGATWQELPPLTDIDYEADLSTVPQTVLDSWGFSQK